MNSSATNENLRAFSQDTLIQEWAERIVEEERRKSEEQTLLPPPDPVEGMYDSLLDALRDLREHPVIALMLGLSVPLLLMLTMAGLNLLRPEKMNESAAGSTTGGLYRGGSMSHASISDRDWADRRPVELSRRDRALKSVEEYEAAYSQSLDEETKAKYLHLIANIYSGQLQDYDSAANYYARIVIRYPESSSAVHAYSDLAYAYENAGRSQLANGVYYQMMQEFPEDSEVHDEAAIALGFRPVPDDDDIDEDPIE